MTDINYNKVVKFISESKESEIDIDEISIKLNISKQEVFEIIHELIDKNSVFNFLTKTTESIGKKEHVNYDSLLKSSKKPKPTSIIYKLQKNAIIQIMSIIVIVYSFFKIIEAVLNVDIPIV